TPGLSYNAVGQTANVAATVFDRQGKPVQGTTVAFTVTGPGATSGSRTSDSSGVASFSFSSSATGRSSITAIVVVGSGSITGNAAANWAGPPSQVTLGLFGATQSAGGLAPVNGAATVVAALTDSGGIPVGDNTAVNFTVTWEAPLAKTVTLAPKQTRAVVGTSHIVVATVTNQFGQPFAGALVRFILLGANAANTTSSFTTLADGRAAFLVRGQNVGVD